MQFQRGINKLYCNVIHIWEQRGIIFLNCNFIFAKRGITCIDFEKFDAAQRGAPQSIIYIPRGYGHTKLIKEADQSCKENCVFCHQQIA